MKTVLSYLAVRVCSFNRFAKLRGAEGEISAIELFSIWQKQGGRTGNGFEAHPAICASCPAIIPCRPDSFVIDHKLAVCSGGNTSKENTQFLCINCNRVKSGRDRTLERRNSIRRFSLHQYGKRFRSIACQFGPFDLGLVDFLVPQYPSEPYVTNSEAAQLVGRRPEKLKEIAREIGLKIGRYGPRGLWLWTNKNIAEVQRFIIQKKRVGKERQRVFTEQNVEQLRALLKKKPEPGVRTIKRE